MLALADNLLHGRQLAHHPFSLLFCSYSSSLKSSVVCVGVLLLIVLAIDPWPFKVSAAFEEVSAMVDSDTSQSSELRMAQISRTGGPS
ncbi:hypothetical protein SETIT_5G171600v2 [Setaria italica]|uniref:Uncharacterized protein n=1 Tax=Setaria italica TaxID=4555 RepID=A0A368R5T2_SETIT|nr:hypothetical protein SETIT_5G171600v2 [Setaria italica]